jgi:predicted alpha/beta superfamily hydrolase
VEEIMPEAEKELPGPPAWRGIAGYSLAGLFALYAICQTDVFSRVGCMSGSLWFPGFKEYVFSHEPKRWADCIYFSLGDREAKTRNPVLKTVQENTEAIHAHFLAQGIDTVFQLNPGNHFVQGIERTVAGIRWLLGR